jgi:uncharacterized protein (DUF433 family)
MTTTVEQLLARLGSGI